MKKFNFDIGDLVKHIRDQRHGIVTTSCKNWRNMVHGIPYCKVFWLKNMSYNLMDVRMLRNITKEGI